MDTPLTERLHDQSVASGAAIILGALAAISVAALLSPVRDEVGPVVVALGLMLVTVVAAAAGGSTAGSTTAFVAALSYNFWHTKPYQSLRIHSGRDIATTALLLVAGLIVGEVARISEARARESADAAAMLASLAIQGDLLARGAAVDEVWAVTRRALMSALDLSDCRFEPFGTKAPPLPRIAADSLVSRQRRRIVGGHFTLPPEGAEIPVEHRGDMLGRIVLVTGDPNVGVSLPVRRFAVTLAEQFAVAVGTSIDQVGGLNV